MGNNREELDELSIIEKKATRLKEYVYALVNGDPISQLFIKSDLTEKAKEELIELQKATINNQIDKEKEILASLQVQVIDLSKKMKELKATIEILKEEKGLLSTDVEILKKKKAMLIESINTVLSHTLSDENKSRLLEEVGEESIDVEEGKKEESKLFDIPPADAREVLGWVLSCQAAESKNKMY